MGYLAVYKVRNNVVNSSVNSKRIREFRQQTWLFYGPAVKILGYLYHRLCQSDPHTKWVRTILCASRAVIHANVPCAKICNTQSVQICAQLGANVCAVVCKCACSCVQMCAQFRDNLCAVAY